MQDLASTVMRLKLVRASEKRFLALWAAECLVRRAENKLHAQLQADEATLADPHNHDWALMYRGSILDD